MATKFSKPITREVLLPAPSSESNDGVMKKVPHLITFDETGVTIRRKKSRHAWFLEWACMLYGGKGYPVDPKSGEEQKTKSNSNPAHHIQPDKTKPKPKVAGIDRTQVALEGEPGPNSKPEPETGSEPKTVFEEMDEAF